MSSFSSTELLTRAQGFVLSEITLLLSGVASGPVASSQYTAQQHGNLRFAAFTRKVSIKRTHFLALRELPRITLLSTSVNNPAALRHSLLKKH